MDNAEKNRFVKKKITDALLTLLETEELKGISVSRIAADAGVSRISFYRNYKDKEDILRTYTKELMADWTAKHNPDNMHPEQDILADIFTYLIDYKDFFLLLRKRNLFYLLKDIIMEICGPKPDSPNFSAYTSAFIAYGLYGWIEEWFTRGMQESPWEMTELLKIGI
jgi:AcrR family transcriptional regulator